MANLIVVSGPQALGNTNLLPEEVANMIIEKFGLCPIQTEIFEKK